MAIGYEALEHSDTIVADLKKGEKTLLKSESIPFLAATPVIFLNMKPEYNPLIL